MPVNEGLAGRKTELEQAELAVGGLALLGRGRDARDVPCPPDARIALRRRARNRLVVPLRHRAEFRDAPEAIPSSFYAMLRLCFRPATGNEEAIPLVPAILHRAMNGDGRGASELATRRLRASGFAPLVNELPVSGDIARRTAAAMLFPISPYDFRLLESRIIKQQNEQNT